VHGVAHPSVRVGAGEEGADGTRALEGDLDCEGKNDTEEDGSSENRSVGEDDAEELEEGKSESAELGTSLAPAEGISDGADEGPADGMSLSVWGTHVPHMMRQWSDTLFLNPLNLAVFLHLAAVLTSDPFATQAQSFFFFLKKKVRSSMHSHFQRKGKGDKRSCGRRRVRRDYSCLSSPAHKCVDTYPVLVHFSSGLAPAYIAFFSF